MLSFAAAATHDDGATAVLAWHRQAEQAASGQAVLSARMISANFLDTANYPTITFQSSTIER